jgi:hypothetical protein
VACSEFLRQSTGPRRQIEKALLKRLSAAGGTLSGRVDPQKWRVQKIELFCGPATQSFRQNSGDPDSMRLDKGKIE